MAAQRILVIEDEAAARDALTSLLADEGYDVCSVGTGRAGLERIRDFRPDMVVCDYYLPDIDGLQVLRQVRSTLHEGVLFVFVTAASGGHEAESILRREADFFFHKPLDFRAFRRVLQRAPQRIEAA